MLVAALLVAVIHHSGSIRYLVAAATGTNPAEATCEGGKPAQRTALVTYGTIVIKCPDPTTLQQDNGGVHVFPSERGDKAALNDLVPGATITPTTGTPTTHTLSVPQLPANEKSIFFHCKVAASGNTVTAKVNGQNAEQHQQEGKRGCYIQVVVPSSPAAGPNGCVVPDGEISLTASDPMRSVQFICAAGKLKPANGQVFDETCTKAVDLKTVVPGAEVKKLQTPENMVEASFPNKPPQEKTLCFTCDTSTDKTCKVFVHVSGTVKSAGLGVAARIVSAFGVAIVAAGLLAM